MLLDTRNLVNERIAALKEITDMMEKAPTLAIIRIGNDPASEKYVKNKIKKCKLAGITSKIMHLAEDINPLILENVISVLNDNANIDAILLQLPLPKHLDEKYFTNLIAPQKDVDGFTCENMGKLINGIESNVACTPAGILDILKENNIEIRGKDVLIINRSNIVGKPLAMLMLKEDATVTIAHSKTKNLLQKVWDADIVVTAIGKPNFFVSEDFKPRTTIIDVSINFDENGNMCGDVCKEGYDELIRKKCNITPVPNGVGQTTVLSLLNQTVKIRESKLNGN